MVTKNKGKKKIDNFTIEWIKNEKPIILGLPYYVDVAYKKDIINHTYAKNPRDALIQGKKMIVEYKKAKKRVGKK